MEALIYSELPAAHGCAAIFQTHMCLKNEEKKKSCCTGKYECRVRMNAQERPFLLFVSENSMDGIVQSFLIEKRKTSISSRKKDAHASDHKFRKFYEGVLDFS
ncbi:MAG: hypothetical protein ABIR48_02980 [Gammaproteobacteria bacterium]